MNRGKCLLVLLMLPMVAMAEGGVKLYEKTLSVCYEVQPFDEKRIERIENSGIAYDEFRYSLRVRTKTKTQILIYNKWDDQIFDKTVDSQVSASEKFTVSERDGGPKALERQVKRRIDELEFDPCEKP